jgi:hypothetical protein
VTGLAARAGTGAAESSLCWWHEEGPHKRPAQLLLLEHLIRHGRGGKDHAELLKRALNSPDFRYEKVPAGELHQEQGSSYRSVCRGREKEFGLHAKNADSQPVRSASPVKLPVACWADREVPSTSSRAREE